MKLALQIAVRFLKASKGQTILIILGIAIGVSVQVFIGSLIQGLQISLVDRTIGNSSHITVSMKDNSYLANYDTYYNDIVGSDENIKDVSYVINQPATILVNEETKPIVMRGFDYNLAEGIYEFKERITDGNLPLGNNEIAIGTSLADALNIGLGDTVSINIPLIGTFPLTIVGIYDFNVTALNDSWILTNLPTLQSILNIGNKISAIEIQVNQVFDADITAHEINNTLNNNNLQITNWKDLNAELLSGLSGQSVSSLMIQVFVTLSVVLGISSVLAVTVLQKSKQIGILKAMGITDSDASKIFLFEGLILGVFGAILGVLLGLGLSLAFSTFALNPDGTPVVDLYINTSFIIISTLVAITASGVASIIPAVRSRKLSVIEVIRNG